jgi:SAM-dependent methyltransferase
VRHSGPGQSHRQAVPRLLARQLQVEYKERHAPSGPMHSHRDSRTKCERSALTPHEASPGCAVPRPGILQHPEAGRRGPATEKADIRERYLRSTNSREWAARLLRDLLAESGSRRVVDIGAGDGALSTALSDATSYVAAIEPDPRMRSILLQAESACPTVEYVPYRVEETDLPSGAFDLALVSYILETISAPERNSVLNAAVRLLEEDGLIVGVSFVEGSAWDQYLEICKNICGGSRYVGFGELVKTLRSHGWFVSRQGNFSSRLIAQDIDELYAICSHFMGKRSAIYLENRTTLLPMLQRLSRFGGRSQVILDVTECIYVICRNRWVTPQRLEIG